MKLNTLSAISPIDGRYRYKVKELSNFFSEEALIKFRLKVEIEYFIALCNIPLKELKNFNKSLFEELRSVYQHFSSDDALKIKEIEKRTNHDVKAVEYFLKKEFDRLGLQEFKEFIHFGLTSQDINNTAIPLSLKEFSETILTNNIDYLLKSLKELADKTKNISMISRTHGQPASPTKLGKEIFVFITRIQHQYEDFRKIPFASKFAGATGNFNAHLVSYPNIDWKTFAKEFIEKTLGLSYSFPTTQIEHYDYLASIFDCTKRINNIIIDLNRDFWHYISIDYFNQSNKSDEIGSSAMPHKVNPIDFENSEGNLGIANALFNFFSNKLPISRLQRDLSDSTVLRNIGVPFSHSIISYQSTIKGIKKLNVNQDQIEFDLNQNWAVITEAIQTILRREGFEKPYESLKNLTQVNKKINKEILHKFIDSLNIDTKIKSELKKITPSNYTGISY
tara:strand:- start:9403 stop:10752 length:1350 start_codon:yes stop_codon:yes gene_type:complete